MMTNPTAPLSKKVFPRLGIIAGGGSAPSYLIQACLRLNRDFFVICLRGHAAEDLATHFPHEWIDLGAALRLKNLIIEKNLQEVVFIGKVRRPSLSELRPDLLAIKVLTKIGLNLLGDDALLRAVCRAVESETGARVVATQDVFSTLLMGQGPQGRHRPDDDAQNDIVRGIGVARLLGKADVGQSVVVQQGIVLGVEAIEGTDALIMRTTCLKREGVGGVLIKMAKPQQDNRFDLPTIGPDTLRALHQAGLRGVAVETGRSLFLDKENTIEFADAHDLFITGVSPDE